ncbi:MAG: hypothetical protein EOO03_08665 [Chitinophagaceae bacterium]|nr:MAG: hypothetical protein EOO03_08665 [Chitinophagaceae bacterium]
MLQHDSSDDTLLLSLASLSQSYSIGFTIRHSHGNERSPKRRASENVFQLALVTCLILLAADFVTEVKCMRFENLKEGSGKTYCSNALFVLLFQNKKLRMLFLASIIFKGLIFLFDYNNGFGMMDKGEYFYNNPYIGMEIFSCHMFVSGIFINTWGHFNNLWLTAERTGASQWQLVKIMASLMAIPVLTDALITLAIILLLKEDLFFYAVYYISVLAIGFPVAIISSIYKPVKVTKKLRSGKNSSVLFMVIMIIAPMLMLLPKKISWMYISYPIIFLIAIICAFAVLKEYNKLRYNLYAVLYKVKE